MRSLLHSAICATFALVFAASTTAQVAEVPSMLSPHTLVDFDNTAGPGPTTLTAINAAGSPAPGNLSGITLVANGAAAGVYNTNPQLGRGLGMDPAIPGGLILVDPPTGAFAAFNSTIQLGIPSTEFGFEVGDWVGPMVLTFYTGGPGGTQVGQVTSSNFDGTGEKFFRAQCGTTFDTIDIVASTTAGNWLFTSFVLQLVVQDPLADFTASPTSGSSPLTVNFTDATCTSNTIALYQWDFESDGTVDSNSQNPTHTYPAVGTYDVTLMVIDSNGTRDSIRKNGFITVVGGGNNTRSADLIEYKFNDVRSGTAVANTALTNTAPGAGTVSNANWSTSAGRTGYSANEPGYGALAYVGSGGSNYVRTGWPASLTSMSIMWWQRAQATAGTTLAYVFGGAGASYRCFTGGVAGSTLWYRASVLGDFQAVSNVQQNIGQWEHIALVVDDQQGLATWYINGQIDATLNFTPGTHVLNNTNFSFGWHTSTTYTYSAYYDLDDFRVYSIALPAPAIGSIAAGGGENPTTNTYGTGCTGPGGTPVIGASGGPPAVGNTSFTIELSAMEASRPAALFAGVFADMGGIYPVDISTFLGAGCSLECTTDISLLAPSGPAGTASIPFAIPTVSALAGLHIYAQGVVIGSGVPFPVNGALTPGLDISIQN